MGGAPPLPKLDDLPRVRLWVVDFTRDNRPPIDPQPGDYVLYLQEGFPWILVRW
ncbi:MAG: hypothetical protein [Wufeng bat tupavirus 2]|nr:MAG: hypothetical protein [Wufeng bat tupavirus 2]